MYSIFFCEKSQSVRQRSHNIELMNVIQKLWN